MRWISPSLVSCGATRNRPMMPSAVSAAVSTPSPTIRRMAGSVIEDVVEGGVGNEGEDYRVDGQEQTVATILRHLPGWVQHGVGGTARRDDHGDQRRQ